VIISSPPFNLVLVDFNSIAYCRPAVGN